MSCWESPRALVFLMAGLAARTNRTSARLAQGPAFAFLHDPSCNDQTWPDGQCLVYGLSVSLQGSKRPRLKNSSRACQSVVDAQHASSHVRFHREDAGERARGAFLSIQFGSLDAARRERRCPARSARGASQYHFSIRAVAAADRSIHLNGLPSRRRGNVNWVSL